MSTKAYELKPWPTAPATQRFAYPGYYYVKTVKPGWNIAYWDGSNWFANSDLEAKYRVQTTIRPICKVPDLPVEALNG